MFDNPSVSLTLDPLPPDHPCDTSVETSFDRIREAVDAVIDETNTAMASGLANRDYAKVREQAAQADALTAWQQRFSDLQTDLEKLCPDRFGRMTELPITPPLPPKRPTVWVKKGTSGSTSHGRLPRGLRTPEQVFFRPILEVLVALGGSARSSVVVSKVHDKVKHLLKDVDYEMVQSGGRRRWWNTTEWARNTLVQDGLMLSDSPHGTWEISEAGRQWLASESGDLHG